ncbi:M28 family peptidase [Rosistilla oblonga]|uniref:Bacterial leucyl aminopeptidase n=1 Tax=Rosistilla oblonga TaxID=2527990 RepID=A0A518IUV8_9BACT|nr:M28 family peptidase [Rosistilla oblonga]QDV56869.1 Bacterial leucyl aminopeptidase precursor [Rosistilla oblonga]
MHFPRYATGLLAASLLLTPATLSIADDPDAAKTKPADGKPAATADVASPHHAAATADQEKLDPKEAAAKEAEWLTGTRQLTFSGRRSGEGYYSADGSQMVFQSEREPGNPFYQIYLLDLETGDLDRVSPGTGKTTCAWIHPDGKRVLFSSTQNDPAAKTKQDEEIAIRESGKQRRYSWDYDPQYELMAWNRETEEYTQLTDAEGYDAEASYSPDGKQIVFASNRVAYERELTPKEAKLFKLDPAAMMDLYIANADGSNVRRLTDTLGYDGGPFFSPDGKRICFRRFSENGATAEVMTIGIDGSDPQQLTNMKAMSWAPYYHPSGDYLIFTTNLHGFGNFELYLIDAAGKSEPVRVTYTDGFDGLPVFSPDGKQLSWSTNRTASGNTQIYTATWNDARARKLLGLDASQTVDTQDAEKLGRQAASQSHADFKPSDIMRHVDYLCRRELGGRLTGTPGEKAATAYVAAYLENLGVKPAGADGSFFQNFEFTAGVELGEGNSLTVGDESFKVGTDWQPLAFSKTGEFEPGNIVFAGYGVVAPGSEEHPVQDAYVHLDVEDKWVMVFRHLPADISAEKRQHWSAYSSLRFKAMVARDRGARGLIVVSGPTSKVRQQLVPLRFDGSLSGTSLGVISVTDAMAAKIVKAAGEELAELQKELDSGEPAMGFDLGEAKLTAKIDVQKQQRVGRNVIGRLQVGDAPSDQAILIGAHIDHLGTGASGNSLARDDERNGVHVGADDNASGVAAMLEVAQYLTDLQRRGKLPAKRDILLAAWSGEELGLLGSDAFADKFYDLYPQVPAPEGHPPLSLYPALSACLNMDMVGRLREKLVLQGIGSSPVWNGEIERRNAPVGLALTLQSDTYLPTDASTFYMRGVPILSAFTGSHSEYHTPRDTPDTLNYEGAAQTARLMGLIARSLATADDAPEYTKHTAPQQQVRAQMRAYLGTIPDYAAGDVKGVMLSGASENGPAAKAGVRGGDLIIELAGRKIENIYDYTYAIEALKIGEEVPITVRRGDKDVKLKVTPGSRD